MPFGLLRRVFHRLSIPIQVGKHGFSVSGQPHKSLSHRSRVSERNKKRIPITTHCLPFGVH